MSGCSSNRGLALTLLINAAATLCRNPSDSFL